jgi:hypothetical protein
MLKVYGQKLPNLRVNPATEKHLYIDIAGKDIGEISALNLPLTETYIITTKKLQDMDQLISLGYYNIACVTKASQITEAFIDAFIHTDYQENYLKIISGRVSSLYVKSGTEIENLSLALAALKNDNENDFVNVMSTHLDEILGRLTEISELSAFCKSLQQNSATYTDAIKKAAQLERVSEEAEKYRKLYEMSQTSDISSSTQIANLEAEIEGLKERINSRTVTSAEIHNSAEYKSIKARLESVTEDRDRIQSEFSEYKTTIAENSDSLNQGGLAELNQKLTEELHKLKEQKISVTVSNKLPIFTNSTTLSAQSILCFKEVRPAVYVNSLISWLDSSLRVFSLSQKKSYLILVVDPLADEFAERKYIKHSWSVGKYTDNMTVLVVPPLRFSTLKSSYHIDSYDILICIDRCHVDVNVFNMTKAKTYYLINTVNDIDDFELDCSKCILFGDKVPAGNCSLPKWHMPCWHDNLATTEIRQRSAKFSKDQIFASILKECGVSWQ